MAESESSSDNRSEASSLDEEVSSDESGDELEEHVDAGIIEQLEQVDVDPDVDFHLIDQINLDGNHVIAGPAKRKHRRTLELEAARRRPGRARRDVARRTQGAASSDVPEHNEPQPTPEQQHAVFQSSLGQGPAPGVKRACSCEAVARRVQTQRHRCELARLRVQREYKEQHGHPHEAYRIRELAGKDPHFVCFTATNFLKFAPKSPEINMVARHPVFLIKIGNLADPHTLRSNYTLTRKGVTAKSAIDAAIKRKLAGERGRWHVMHSREKLPWCLRLLAGEKGTKVTCRYILNRWRNNRERTGKRLGQDPGPKGHPEKDNTKQTAHREKRIGGRYILGRRWT